MRGIIAVLSAFSFFCLVGCGFPNGQSPEDSTTDTTTDTTTGTTTESAAARKDILVAVNGLQFTRTLPGELLEAFGANLSFATNREDYLNPALTPWLGDGYDIRTFDWTGDATETGDILQPVGSGSLRAFLRAAHAEARTEGVRFVVVSHSWGTFLCYMALAMESTGEDPIECDLFITLSCPIGANNAGSITDPLDAAVSAYAEAWMEDLGFAIGGGSYPRAKRFLNYWAWGDCISGPLAGLAPAAAGALDVQVDIFGVRDATSLKRGIDDVRFWHEFTTLNPEVANDPDYAAGEGFADSLSGLVAYFREVVVGEIARAGSHPGTPPADKRLRLALTAVQCVREPEWWNSEFYGFFRILRDGKAIYVRKWWENAIAAVGDVVCTWLQEGETESVNWVREVPAVPGIPIVITLDAAIYEDDLGGDGPPGKGSVSFSFDGSAWTLPGATGSFDCGWSDYDDEYNVIRVYWSASLVDD